MQVIDRIGPELTASLDLFKDWVFRDNTQRTLHSEIARQPFSLFDRGDAEASASLSYLAGMDHGAHVGYPLELRGVDLNYETVKKLDHRFDEGFVREIRDVNFEVDSQLQTYLGAKLSALKAFYPSRGYIAWHTNWNAPGYNIVFTYSPSGKGYWRHIDPTGAESIAPREERLVHIPDTPGWHCKAGYFGTKAQTDRIVWHSAYTDEPRVTLSYVIADESIWKNVVNEIKEQA